MAAELKRWSYMSRLSPPDLGSARNLTAPHLTFDVGSQ